jgi:hypothetical protein
MNPSQMAASASEAAAETQQQNTGAGSAAVTFRVRCETLGHGESVYLVSSGDPTHLRVSPFVATMSRCLPLHTIRAGFANIATKKCHGSR